MISYADLNAADVLNQTDVLAAWLAEFLPSADTSPGTVYRELFLRPTAAAAVSHATEYEKARNSLSLAWALAHPEQADPVIIQAMASNFGIVPREGTRSKGVLKLTLSDPYRMVLPEGTTFSFGDRRFDSTQRVITTLEPTGPDDIELIKVDRIDATTRQSYSVYECIVPVQAHDVGSDGNLVVGTRLTNVTSIPQVIEVRVYQDLVGGTDPEGTTVLVNRVVAALASKSLASRTHVSAMLQENFPSILASQIVGACQPEMRRDRINLLGIATGGKVDLYLRTAGLPAREYITAKAELIDPAQRLFMVNLSPDEAAGIVTIRSISTRMEVVNMTVQDVTWGFQAPLTDVPVLHNLADARFSRYQTVTVRFINEDVVGFSGGSTVYLGVDRLPDIAAVQTFLLTNQNMGSDYLAKMPIPCYVAPNLVLKVPSGLTVDTDAVQIAVARAVNQVHFTKYGLSLASIVSAVFHAVPTGVQPMIPPSLDVSLFLPDGTTVLRRVASDLNPASLASVSNRLVAFFCWPDTVTITTEALE